MKTNLLLLSLLLVAGCARPLDSLEQVEMDRESVQTKAAEAETYYWYAGSKIPLTLDLQNVNVIYSESRTKGVASERTCRQSVLAAGERVDDMNDYRAHISALKDNPNVVKVTPYYERGEGVAPIGTSDKFCVKVEDSESDALLKIASGLGVQVIEEVPYMPGWFVMSIVGSGFENSVEATNFFYESGLCEDVDPLFMFDFRPSSVNDPYFDEQWALKNTANPDYDINIEGAWAITRGAGAKIAIIDTPVEHTHPDLSQNCNFPSYNAMTSSSPSSTIADDHGTQVAGIMVAKGNNNYGTAGVAYESGLMRVSHNLDPERVTTSVELASGISWAWSMGADVINCSWGDHGGQLPGLHTSALEDAIDNALTWGRSGKGCVVVFAAGNEAPAMDYPGTFDDRIITVGSIGNTGVRSTFSGYGTKLDVVAPGENIMTTYPNYMSGLASATSMATPHVSGIAALIISENPSLTREEVTRIIEQSANKINPGVYLYGQYQNRYNGSWNPEMGYGLVDAARAVAIARDANLTPPASSPKLDFYVMTGASAIYDDWFVMVHSQNAAVSFALKPAQINAAYTYYWHFTTSGDYNWEPYFTLVGNYNGVNMNIPRPSMDSVLTVSCEVYNGSTHVCTATKSLTVRLNFP